jgi:hypothetical protein
MVPAALPPVPDAETGLPRPPHAPGGRSARSARRDWTRISDSDRAPSPPAGQGPVLAWYQVARAYAVSVGCIGSVLTAGLLTIRDSLAWTHYWWVWLVLIVIGLLVGYTQWRGDGRCSAGARWVMGRKNWVRTYDLVKVTASLSAGGSVIDMRDADGRRLSVSLSLLEQDRMLWDLVYNGILHSVIAGQAETNGRLHLHLRLPYPSPY